MIRHRLAARFARLREANGARLRVTQRDAGFTVLEALISFVIFAIVATTASYGLVEAIDASHTSQQRVDAADVAQFILGNVIRTADTAAPEEGKTIFSHVGGQDAAGVEHASDEEFTAVETVVFDTPGSCNSGTLFWVHIVVRQAQTDTFLARTDARVACPRV
jgi:type II secretory pathway pseudopilin PulG